MKKQVLRLVALVMAVVMLSGCSILERYLQLRGLYDGGSTAFSDMEYERPDPEDFMNYQRQCIALAEAGEDLDALTDCFWDLYAEYDRFYTMYTLADIHYSIDMSDLYWSEEYDWCVEKVNEIDAGYDQLMYALAASKLRPELESEDLFGAGYFDSYEGQSIWDERLTEMMEAESALITRYEELSIALWYIGYNGVTTWFTTYISRVMGEGIGGASTCLLVATGGAILSYIPAGNIASKIGRRKTIMGGVVLLASCFLLGGIIMNNATSITIVMYIIFALVGLAWAAINVNSLPMVVEMCKGSEVGKFTGYYYTFSMAAQVVTPIVAGTLLRNVGYKILFPYAAFFVALAFVTMSMVRHGDNKVEAKKGLDAFDVDD